MRRRIRLPHARSKEIADPYGVEVPERHSCAQSCGWRGVGRYHLVAVEAKLDGLFPDCIAHVQGGDVFPEMRDGVIVLVGVVVGITDGLHGA